MNVFSALQHSACYCHIIINQSQRSDCAPTYLGGMKTEDLASGFTDAVLVALIYTLNDFPPCLKNIKFPAGSDI